MVFGTSLFKNKAKKSTFYKGQLKLLFGGVPYEPYCVQSASVFKGDIYPSIYSVEKLSAPRV